MIRGRLRKPDGDGEAHDRDEAAGAADYIEIDPRELTDVFAVPQRFRDVGLTSWLFVGVAISASEAPEDPGRQTAPAPA